jgi:hypothetical protein
VLELWLDWEMQNEKLGIQNKEQNLKGLEIGVA